MTDRQRAITAVGFAGLLLFVLMVGFVRRGERHNELLATREITYRIDPNTADADTLCLLPRIGPGIAERIVNDREVNGRFNDPMDMERVPLIGVKTRAAFEPWIEIAALPE